MGLPIGIGSKSISSRHFERPELIIEEYDEDVVPAAANDGTIENNEIKTTLLQPVPIVMDSDRGNSSTSDFDVGLISYATSSDQTLQAFVSVHYCDMIRQEEDEHDPAVVNTKMTSNNVATMTETPSLPTPVVEKEEQEVLQQQQEQEEMTSMRMATTTKKSVVVQHTSAQITIQISPLVEPFSTMASSSSSYRDSVFRIPMPTKQSSSSSSLVATTRTGTTRSEEKQEEEPEDHHISVPADGHNTNIDNINNTAQEEEEEQLQSSSSLSSLLSVEFSPDQRSLVCLIPHPRINDICMVVVFQLRKPRMNSMYQSSMQRNLPPLPSYIQQQSVANSSGATTTTSANSTTATSSNNNNGATTTTRTSSTAYDKFIVPVATKPKIVALTTGVGVGEKEKGKETPILNVTALCRHTIATATNGSGGGDDGSSNNSTSNHHHDDEGGESDIDASSIMFLGCRDGSIWAVIYRPLLVLDKVVTHSITNKEEEQGQRKSAANSNLAATADDVGNNSSLMIVAMEYLTEEEEWYYNTPPQGGGSATSTRSSGGGKLLVLYDDGKVMLYRLSCFSSVLSSTMSINNNINDDSEKTTYSYTSNNSKNNKSAPLATGAITTAPIMNGGGVVHNNNSSTSHLDDCNKHHNTNNNNNNHGHNINHNDHDHTTGGGGVITLTQTHVLDGSTYMAATWISGSYLAIIRRPQQQQPSASSASVSSSSPTDDSKCLIQVWGLYDDDHRIVPISTFEMTYDRLIEDSNTTYLVEKIEAHQKTTTTTARSLRIPQQQEKGTEHQRGRRRRSPAPTTYIEYDPVSDCLAVSSYITKTKLDRGDNGGGGVIAAAYQFVCVWSWRSNTLGLCIAPSYKDNNNKVAAGGGTAVEEGKTTTTTTTTRSRNWCYHHFDGSSTFHFARNHSNNMQLVHFISSSTSSSSSVIRKETYGIAMVSPPNEQPTQQPQRRTSARLRTSSSCSCLIMSSNTVIYPIVHVTTGCSLYNNNNEVEWQEVTIPASYLASCGSPFIGLCGQTYGRSIGIASSKGLCILQDCQQSATSKKKKKNNSIASSSSSSNIISGQVTRSSSSRQPRWYLFGNETQERQFRVISMSWWEGGEEMMTTAKDDDNSDRDDILVAIIEVIEGGKSNVYLSCWSPRRLDANHQLIISGDQNSSRRKRKDTTTTKPCWGLRIPNQFCYLDLLTTTIQPPHQERRRSTTTTGGGGEVTTHHSNNNNKRTAVIMLSDSSQMTNYRIYQVQVSPPRKEAAVALATDYLQDNPYEVLIQRVAMGSIGSPVELFLASACLDFDIMLSSSTTTTLRSSSSSSSVVAAAVGGEDAYYVATIGVIHRYGGGMDAIAISSSSSSSNSCAILAKSHVIDPVVGNNEDEDNPTDSELSSCSLTDVIYDRPIVYEAQQQDDNVMPVDFFVWTIQLASGKLRTWSVPIARGSMDVLQIPAPSWLPQSGTSVTGRRSGTQPYVVYKDGLGLGMVHPVGETSTWMSQSTMRTRRDILMGCVPRSRFGCIISVAQSCRKLHRSLGEEFEHELFRPDFLDHEILTPGDIILNPPAFVVSMYALLFDTALLLLSCCTQQQQHGLQDHDDDDAVDYVSKYLGQKLSMTSFSDTSIMAIRLLILRSVEHLAEMRRRSSKKKNDIVDTTTTTTTMMHVRIAEGVYALLAEAIRRQTTPLQFATIFIEVGRQIEPSCHDHLYPLPASPDKRNPREKISLLELVAVPLQHGSIQMAVAALPLIADNDISRSICISVFKRCLRSVDDCFNDAASTHTIDLRQEAVNALGSIFRYASKIDEPEWDNEDDEDDEDDEDEGEEFLSDAASDHSEEGNDGKSYSLICGSWFRGGGQNRVGKIHDETTKLVANGYANHKDGKNIAEREAKKRNGDHTRVRARPTKNNAGVESVSVVAARYMVSLLLHSSPSIRHRGWKKIGALAQLIVGNDVAGLHLCSSSTFENIIRSTTTKRFTSLLLRDGMDSQERVVLIKFFSTSISACQAQISSNTASCILDLILILLDREYLFPDRRDDDDDAVAGLLLIAVVVAHVADRTSDIVENDLPSKVLVWDSFISIINPLE